MIIAVFDYGIKGVAPVLTLVDYKEHMKGQIHFDEQVFPLSSATLEFIYVGF